MNRNRQYNASKMQSLALVAAKIQMENFDWLTTGEAEKLREFEFLLQTFADYLSHVDPVGYLDRLQENLQAENARPARTHKRVTIGRLSD